jgi:hypothetical protein
MENQIFVIADRKKQYFFSLEQNAALKADALNKKYESQKVSEEVFKNMLNDNIFLDAAEYSENSKKLTDVDLLDFEQQENKTENVFIDMPTKIEESAGIDLKEVLKEINFLKNQLSDLQKENLILKNKKVLDLETAKKLYDKKQELLKNRSIFENALDNSRTALNEMQNIIDYDENKSYRLTLNVLDHAQQEAGTLFGISNNLVIMEVLNHINLKVNEKINFINSEVNDIENKFN